MTDSTVREKLEGLGGHRDEVLWWEICCLLHDVGKLSDEFVFYRQRWHLMKMGYSERDPHDHGWLERDPALKQERFKDLSSFFRQVLAIGKADGAISVVNAVHNHGKPVDQVGNMLKAGDGADARYDRNNPLPSCEQTDFGDAPSYPQVFQANAFGYEPAALEPGQFERSEIDKDPVPISGGTLSRARVALYAGLDCLLRRFYGIEQPRLDHDVYADLRRCLRRHFLPALSDTTRPSNDTDLWEHVFSVASITKAIHLRSLWEGDAPRDAQFRLWGCGFDSRRFLSFAHRIGDVLGRRQVLHKIQEAIIRHIEYEVPLGNLVYRDDDLVLFMLPAIEKEEFERVARWTEDHLCGLALKISRGEVVPRFRHLEEPVTALTRIVELMRGLRRDTQAPSGEYGSRQAAFVERLWRAGGQHSICAVCRTRPADKSEEDKLCSRCTHRRSGHTKGYEKGAMAAQTPMIAEIAGRRQRAVLIVAKLGLDEWLEGELVRTNLVTQRDGLEKMEVWLKSLKVKEGTFEADAKERLARLFVNGGDFSYAANLRRIQDRSGHAATAFLYGRCFEGKGLFAGDPMGGWRIMLEDARAEHPDKIGNTDPSSNAAATLHLACAKTPTPSTILDVWETAEAFFKSIEGGRERFGMAGEEVLVKDPSLLSQIESLGARGRHWFSVDRIPDGMRSQEALEIEVAGNMFEGVYEGNNRRFWIVDGRSTETEATVRRGDTIRLRKEGRPPEEAKVLDADYQKNAYLPYRAILTSPDSLYLLASADQAVAITEAIFARYKKEFGKAYGRLPLSIGHVYFPSFLPMFSVLDAARRMEETFRERNEKVLIGPLPLDPSKDGLELKLGTGAEDWFHPYVITAEPQADEPSYFQTIFGPVVRMDELQPEDQVRLRANWYDSVFLGASADRFKVGQPEEGSRETDPILLEQFLGTSRQEGVVSLWRKIQASGVSDSSLRNFEQLLLRKRRAWRGHQGAAESLLHIASHSLPRELNGIECRSSILESIKTGLFFRTLNLYLRILKGGGDADERNKAVSTKAISC